MALIFSRTSTSYTKPFSPINPNFRFNHSQRSAQFPRRSSSFSFPAAIEWKLRPRVLVLNNTGEDSGQGRLEEAEVDDIGVKAALSMLRFYKREISPLLPNSCRYIPTCSEYSMIAYKKYGVVKGTILTAWRLCRCNPLGGSGFDPPRWFGEPSPPEQ